MDNKTKEIASKLRKYSKEQIINGISNDFQACYFMQRLLDNIEYAAQQETLDAHSAAIDAERTAARACMDWRMDMCDKYGGGHNVKLVDIPTKEISMGAELKKVWKKAQEKERILDKKVNKMLNIGGTE